MKELLDISNAASEVLDAATKFIEPGLHPIEAVFYRYESLLRRRSIVIALLRRHAANQMVLLSMLTGAAREVGYDAA